MKYRRGWTSLMLLALCAGVARADEWEQAREHFQKGRYAEAEEAYGKLREDEQRYAPATIRISEIQQARGEYAAAVQTVEQALKEQPKSADLLARLGELQFLQGKYPEAEKNLAAALKLDADHLRARINQADLFAETGRLKQADAEYVWFVRYYNRAQPTQAEELMYVARGSLQYARWHSASQIFGFVINTLCPDALKADKLHWQASYVSGDLLLEKYNPAQALPEFQEALAINPQAAEAHVALGRAALQDHEEERVEELAERALKINPNLVSAMWLLADVAIADGQLKTAAEILERALQVNPVEQRTLARLAACCLLSDGPPADADLDRMLRNLDNVKEIKLAKPDRFSEILMQVAQRNPHPGPFLNEVAQTVESQRKYPLAEKLYRRAIETMPQLSEPKTQLGMLYMRVGKHAEAGKLLDDAFKSDPYHVRVSNMRKVLRVLNGYEKIETEHFIIHVDSELDKILGQYMADYLEEIYPELVDKLGFEPPQRTHFEIYNRSKGLSGHEWFSARMTGLPWIQTVGASTGVIVALTSPTAADEPFNWARVLKHEFVHVITLQQTNFNIPHWFTEALAVTHEGGDGPSSWNKLLLERVPAGDLRDLSNLSEGFTRPKSPDDWSFAYCQSRLYAKYMTEKFGPETIPALLEAYRDNIPTAQAIPRVFKVPLKEFEQGYRDYLNQLVAAMQGVPPKPKRTFDEIEAEYEKDRENLDNKAEYAYALLQSRERTKAEELASEVREKSPNHPLACFTLAAIAVRAEELDQAIELLKQGLDEEKPEPRLLQLLAKIYTVQENWTEAENVYLLGQKKLAYDDEWLKGLAKIYIETDQEEPLVAVLQQLVEIAGDDPLPRKKLAEYYMREKQWEQATKYARLALQVDILDAEVHTIYGIAAHALKDDKTAARELEVALKLAPDVQETRLALAEVYLDGDQPEKARPLIEAVLSKDANHKQALELKQRLP